MPIKTTFDPGILSAALEGLELQRKRIELQIAEIRRALGAGSKASAVSPAAEPTRRRRKLSAAGRKRIAEAQKKRWAAFHKGTEVPTETPKLAQKAAPAQSRNKKKAAGARK
ncbi:MAG: hypothetical protein ABFD89_07430 [Bryobacteraceae bacterium]